DLSGPQQTDPGDQGEQAAAGERPQGEGADPGEVEQGAHQAATPSRPAPTGIGAVWAARSSSVWRSRVGSSCACSRWNSTRSARTPFSRVRRQCSQVEASTCRRSRAVSSEVRGVCSDIDVLSEEIKRGLYGVDKYWSGSRSEVFDREAVTGTRVSGQQPVKLGPGCAGGRPRSGHPQGRDEADQVGQVGEDLRG